MLTRELFSVKKYALGLALFVLAMGLGIGYIAGKSHIAGGQTATFNGIITEINDGCVSGGYCSLTVERKSIIIGGGKLSNPEDNVYGKVSSNIKIGNSVFVKALKTSTGFTLQHCSKCYVTKQ